MKKLIVIAAAILVVGIFGADEVMEFIASRNVVPADEGVRVPQNDDKTSNKGTATTEEALPDRSVVAENLTIPWEIIFLSEHELLVSERSGTLARIDTKTGTTHEIDVPDVSHRGEGGLLGMALHPDFQNTHYLYLYLTSRTDDESAAAVNRVVRYRFLNETLAERTIIVESIPGALYHDGGRLAFGPDGYLYITTGDARMPELAQDTGSLAGAILRVTEDGGIPDENPFGTRVYSYGHRNPQGLTWDAAGNLWSTEHGRTSATQSGMDELNLIIPGGNYGWPESEGDTVREGTIGPKIHSGPSVTWAPASAAYYDGSIFFGGLRGATLYEAVLAETDVIELREHLVGEYGRIRTVRVGPNDALYITTSNRDGRGNIEPGHDMIIRLNPAQFRE